jgi:tetratricopeptide (TPR) repeat protein
MKTRKINLASTEFSQAMKLCETAGDKPGQAIALKNRGDMYFATGEFEIALPVYHQAMKIIEKTGNQVEHAELDLRLGKTLLMLGRQDDAQAHLVNSIAVAGKLKLQKIVMDAQVELSGLYERQGRAGEALALFKKVVAMRESQLRQKAGLVLTDMDARNQADENVLNILLLTKEKQLKDLRIKKFNSFLAIAAALMVMAVLLLLLVIRNTRMKVAYRSALLQHRLFSSQLNPQVVYGGLNDIMQYIKRSEPEPAAKYLSHFSRFLQTTLYGTQKEFIPLEKEMLQLQNYLDLQQMCHPGLFSFSIFPPGDSDPGELAIPPFLVQPFLANAVGTVIKSRPGNGCISVSFQVNENVLSVTLDHNSIPGKTTGMADIPVEDSYLKVLTLTRERLAILWKKGWKTKFIRSSVITDPATGEQISRVRMELPVIRI